MTTIRITPIRRPAPPSSLWAWLLWAFFGNEDDGTAPMGYMESSPLWWRRVCWWFRNPLHNLMFYVIGMSGEPATRSGDYPDSVFNPGGGWNRCVHVSESGRSARFWSYIGWCKFYWGPRERGNFGIKLTANRR